MGDSMEMDASAPISMTVTQIHAPQSTEHAKTSDQTNTSASATLASVATPLTAKVSVTSALMEPTDVTVTLRAPTLTVPTLANASTHPTRPRTPQVSTVTVSTAPHALSAWMANGICQSNDRDCINIDECVLEIDNCDENAACSDTEGSFTCECNQGSLNDEWWGKGVVGNRGAPGCFSCTKCQAGFHEVQPCTSTTDRICRRDIPATVLERSFFDYNNGGGRFTIESEADENRQCLTIQKGD